MSIPLTLKARNKLVADDILNLIMFFFFFFLGGGGGGGGGVREDDNPCESSVRLMECQTLFSLKKKNRGVVCCDQRFKLSFWRPIFSLFISEWIFAARVFEVFGIFFLLIALLLAVLMLIVRRRTIHTALTYIHGAAGKLDFYLRVKRFLFYLFIARGMCQEALDLEKKGLRVNVGKTKIVICGTGLDLLQSSGEFPCAVCRTGVGSNSIFCNGRKHWVHKKCSGLKLLTKDPDYTCTRCKGTAHPLDGRPQNEVQVGPDKLEVVASFCYLGDMLSVAGLLWTFNRNVWKPLGRSSRICYQFSLHATSLSRHMAVRTALLCGAQCSTPVRLGHWQSQTSSVCSEVTGQWSDRSAMSGRKTLSPPGPMSYLRGLALRIWTSFWRR